MKLLQKYWLDRSCRIGSMVCDCSSDVPAKRRNRARQRNWWYTSRACLTIMGMFAAMHFYIRLYTGILNTKWLHRANASFSNELVHMRIPSIKESGHMYLKDDILKTKASLGHHGFQCTNHRAYGLKDTYCTHLGRWVIAYDRNFRDEPQVSVVLITVIIVTIT